MVNLRTSELTTKQEDAPKKAIKKGYESILHRFQTCEIYSSQKKIAHTLLLGKNENDTKRSGR